jgi:Arylsulfotransferase (ASST)
MAKDKVIKLDSFLVILLLCALIITVPSNSTTQSKPVYISPSNSAIFMPAETTIAVRYNSRVFPGSVQPDLFDVEGSLSGRHTGATTVADDNMTILFKPHTPFSPTESVSVLFGGGALGLFGEEFGSFQSKFSITPKEHPSVTLSAGASAQGGAAKPVGPNAYYNTVPYSLPVISVTNYGPHSADDFVFLNTSSATNPQFLMILDGNGQLVYYKPLQQVRAYTDFTEQPNGLLSYFDGATNADFSNNVFRVMDASYNEVDQYEAGNGYSADSHEFRLLPNGHALMAVYDEEPMDLTAQGGKANAVVSDMVVQELDSSKNVVFQWKASEHIPYTDTYEKLTGDTVDPYHGNSIDMLPDGNLLVSFRHLSQIVKVNRQTGDVIWRMGGKNNDFTVTNDGGFSYQHDVRQLPNGHITMFDNGNQHTPPSSRAVEYAVDEANRTLTKVWEFKHTPGIFGSYMGDVEQLPNGSVFIGWGGPNPFASEVTRNGKLLQDLEVSTPTNVVYRWFKLPWSGNPDTAPALAAQTIGENVQLYFSWNGATEVAAYQVEAAKTPDTFTPITTVAKQGFETSALVGNALAAECYYRVLAIDTAGNDMRYSNTVSTPGAGCA